MKYPYILTGGLCLAFWLPVYADTVLTVNAFVNNVLQANPQLKIRTAAWQAAIAHGEQQSRLNDPELSYRFAPMTLDNSDKNTVGQVIQISQALPFPGKLTTKSRIAEYQAKDKKLALAQTRQQLRLTANSLFADWYFVHQAIHINRQHQALLKRLKRIALARYSAGHTLRQDVLQAEMALASNQQQTLALQRQRKVLRARLNSLLNRPPQSPLPPPQSLPIAKKLPGLKQFQRWGLDYRLELQQADTRIDTFEQHKRLAQLDAYPDVKISAGYNSLWNDNHKRFNIGIGINLPLDSRKRNAAARQAQARIQQAHWQKQDWRTTILQQISEAYAALEESQQLLTLYQTRLLPLARQTLDTAISHYQSGYPSGTGDFLTILRSEEKQLETRLQREKIVADHFRQQAQLAFAAGLNDVLQDERTAP